MGIYLILPTLMIIFFSLLIVRAGAIALMMTGMDQKRARFQALSLFSGTGFTTREAETIVNHPQRRQIATWLMILGNAGMVTVIVTATSSLVTSQGYQLPISIFILTAGIYIIYRLMSRTGLTRKWERFIQGKFIMSQAFERSTTEDLLHLVEGYGLVRATITQDSSLISHSSIEINTEGHPFLVVGIERDKKWISLPKSREIIKEGDKLVVYGELNVLKELFKEVIQWEYAEL
jgi:hypothetical protein